MKLENKTFDELRLGDSAQLRRLVQIRRVPPMQDVEHPVREHQRPRKAASGDGGDEFVAGQDLGFETGGRHAAIIGGISCPPG